MTHSPSTFRRRRWDPCIPWPAHIITVAVAICYTLHIHMHYINYMSPSNTNNVPLRSNTPMRRPRRSPSSSRWSAQQPPVPKGPSNPFRRRPRVPCPFSHSSLASAFCPSLSSGSPFHEPSSPLPRRRSHSLPHALRLLSQRRLSLDRFLDLPTRVGPAVSLLSTK